jgi:hypothetical protein
MSGHRLPWWVHEPPPAFGTERRRESPGYELPLAVGGHEVPAWVGGDAPGEVPSWVHEPGDPGSATAATDTDDVAAIETITRRRPPASHDASGQASRAESRIDPSADDEEGQMIAALVGPGHDPLDIEQGEVRILGQAPPTDPSAGLGRAEGLGRGDPRSGPDTDEEGRLIAGLVGPAAPPPGWLDLR